MTTKKTTTKDKKETKEHTCDEHCDHNHNPDHNHNHEEPAWTKQIVPDEVLKLNIAWEKLSKPYLQTLDKASRGIKLDGFRQGKVPTNLIKDSLNQEELIKQTLHGVIGEVFNEALKESQLDAIAEPEFLIISADEGKDWEVEAHLAVRPKITLKDYQKILKTAKDSAKKELAKQNEKNKSDEKDEKNRKSDQETPAQLSDKQINNLATDRALQALHSKFTPNVNRLLVTRQASKELEQLLSKLKQFNVELDTYLKNSGITSEELGAQMMQSALQNLQMEFLLDALIEVEKITVTEDEILKKLEQISPELKDEDQKKKLLEDLQTRTYLDAMAKRQKIADWLINL